MTPATPPTTTSWQRLLGLATLATLAVSLTGCASFQPSSDADGPPVQLSTPAPAPDDAYTLAADEAMLQANADANTTSPSLQIGSDAPDLWARLRAGFAMPDLVDTSVEQRERAYTNRPDYMQRMTERSRAYLFHIVEEIEKRGMPTELALLPFVESAFNPQALSGAKASGIWQFIPSTGRSFALKQNVFRDDRRDVQASTRAALDYLSRLYGMFNDWHLALAAYNWGEGSVKRAIANNQRAGLPTDYLSLNMPKETRQYVPKLQAIKNIVTLPVAFNVTLAELPNHPYFATVKIDRDIDVALAAKLAGVTPEVFRQLNPQMNKPVILAAGTEQILLPFENAEVFSLSLKAYDGPLASWTAWVAPSTMRTAEAAKHVGMNEAQLRELNRIPQRMLIKAGSTLLVARAAQHEQDVSSHLADNAMMALAPEAVPRKGRKGRAMAKAEAKLAKLGKRSADRTERLASAAGAKAATGKNKRSTGPAAAAGKARTGLKVALR
jgi:membrane-bound lytic murein transglycosylase D